MKTILRGYGIGMSTDERQNARAQAADMVRTRGTAIKPQPPRDIFAQAGPRGVLLNWRQGAKVNQDLAGFRIYKDNENSLFAEIRDPNTTQHFVELTAGSSPPPTNVFVSTINKLGQESQKVQVIATSTVEASAPAMPVTPPSFKIQYTIPKNPRLQLNNNDI